MPCRVWSIYSHLFSVFETRASSFYRVQLQAVAFTYAHPADHPAGSLVPLCCSMGQLSSLLHCRTEQALSTLSFTCRCLWTSLASMMGSAFCRYSALVLMKVTSYAYSVSVRYSSVAGLWTCEARECTFSFITSCSVPASSLGEIVGKAKANNRSAKPSCLHKTSCSTPVLRVRLCY